MTKKDYELIAAAIKKALDVPYAAVAKAPGSREVMPAWPNAVLEVALNLSDALAADNPRFAPNYFLHACGFMASGDSRKLVWSVDNAR